MTVPPRIQTERVFQQVFKPVAIRVGQRPAEQDARYDTREHERRNTTQLFVIQAAKYSVKRGQVHRYQVDTNGDTNHAAAAQVKKAYCFQVFPFLQYTDAIGWL